MMHQEAVLQRLLQAWDSEVEAPPALESLIAEIGAADSDRLIERLRAATASDFADLADSLSKFPSAEIDEARLSRRLGWTVAKLAKWSPKTPKNGLVMEAALASVAFWNRNGDFWEAIKPQLLGHTTILAALAAIVSSRAPRTQVPANAPVWERERLQVLHDAERSGEWGRLAEQTSLFNNLPTPDLGAWHATLGLLYLGWPVLVWLADRAKGWLQAHMLLQPLPLADSLRLASATRSEFVRFAALERVTRREKRPLTPPEVSALRNFLIVLSKDPESWPRWLAVCNQYPLRHPHIQIALGQALARMGDEALQAYVDSVVLSTSDSGMRVAVSECLGEFRTRAAKRRRQILWRKAYERWDAWDFGSGEGEGLNKVGVSPLDYGVMGWLVEGERAPSRSELDVTFERDLAALDARWHSSLSSITSAFLRLISRYQMHVHAGTGVTADGNWLMAGQVYVPTTVNAFVQRRYRWDPSGLPLID